jgi:type II secretion system protein G
MKFLCPHCRHKFGPKPLAVCPACGKGMRTPARFTSSYAQRRLKVERRRRDEAAERAAVPLPKALLDRKPAILGAMLALLTITGGMLVLFTRDQRPVIEDWRLRKATGEVAVLNAALDLFRADCGRFPSTAEGLVALVLNPGTNAWRGPYVNLVKPDPWLTRYLYSTDGTNAWAASAGPDKIPGSADDIRPPKLVETR